jgi:hypothetical protein
MIKLRKAVALNKNFERRRIFWNIITHRYFETLGRTNHKFRFMRSVRYDGTLNHLIKEMRPK